MSRHYVAIFIDMMKIDTATKQLLRDPVKRRAWVIYQLSLQGRSLASLAREFGMDRTAVSQALRHSYPRMERRLAEALGVPVTVLFPDRYAPDGKRLIRRGRPAGSGKKSINTKIEHNTPHKGRNINKQEAA